MYPFNRHCYIPSQYPSLHTLSTPLSIITIATLSIITNTLLLLHIPPSLHPGQADKGARSSPVLDAASPSPAAVGASPAAGHGLGPGLGVYTCNYASFEKVNQ